MAARFDIEMRDDVVVVHEEGTLRFEETQQALADAIEAALEGGTRKILFDHRRVDLANYYSHIVRHADLAPGLGLDASFRIALVGLPEQDDVLSFIVMVGRNRGWNSQRFFDFDAALLWLQSAQGG
jgi:hypothetical protein